MSKYPVLKFTKTSKKKLIIITISIGFPIKSTQVLISELTLQKLTFILYTNILKIIKPTCQISKHIFHAWFGIYTFTHDNILDIRKIILFYKEILGISILK